MKIQISFLGKSKSDPKTGYRETTYLLPDGNKVTTAFLGPKLAQAIKPDRFYILGTAGSMWEMLLETLCPDICDEESIEDLWESAQSETVTEALLQKFELMLSKQMGITCCLRVISYARDESEQAELLKRLAEWLNQGDELVLDVTHGLRHLPMVMLAAAHYLEQIRKVTVQEIYYGALELSKEGETPVLSLKGLLRLLDWVQALAAHTSSGNYAVFQPLLQQAGISESITDSLAKAAYFERITSPVQAREKLVQTQKPLEQLNDPIAGLFRDELIERTKWWRTGNRGDWEAKLAWRWLERGDYVRAAIYAQEALISRNTSPAECNEFSARKNVADNLKQNPKAKELFHIRNNFAHGVLPDDKKTRDKANQLLSDENNLRNKLKELMSELLGKK